MQKGLHLATRSVVRMSPQPPEVVAGEQTMFQGSGSVKIEIWGNTSRSGRPRQWGRGLSGIAPPSTGGCNGNLGACCSPGLWKDKFLWQKERCRAVDMTVIFLFPHKEEGQEKKARKKGN